MMGRQADREGPSHIPSWAVPGQQVVCIKIGGWTPAGDAPPIVGPAFGEICTIELVVCDPFGDVFLLLREFAPPSVFLASEFRPVDPREVEREMFAARQCGADVELAAGADDVRRPAAPLDRERA